MADDTTVNQRVTRPSSKCLKISGCLLVLVLLAAAVVYFVLKPSPPAEHNKTLPPGLKMGAASSAYQVEGAWNIDGKGENIWDNFTHYQSEWIKDRQTGDVACDSYHKYKDDVRMVKETGFELYRFSISWSRVLPNGSADVINQPGIDYYHMLIDELLDNGIQPMVTMYHWDLPQPLQNLGGWLNPLMADFFANYTDLLFREFGNKVKWWITINESFQVCKGYGDHLHAPGMNDHGVSDYLAGHNLLRAHAKAYRLYEAMYKPTQKGRVGLTNFAAYDMPLDPNSAEDRDAATRSLQFELGIFAHPIFSSSGDYPNVVRERVDQNSKAEGRNTSRLPSFTAQEIEDIRGSFDFFGVNHYYTHWVTSGLFDLVPSVARDSGAVINNTAPYPEGFRCLLNWIKNEYNNPPIFVGENGCGSVQDLNDTDRIEFYHGFIQAMLEAIYEDGCNVIGYNMWSIMDNFEWSHGYTLKFGLWHVDFNSTDRPRQMKQSAYFVRKMLQTRQLPDLPFIS